MKKFVALSMVVAASLGLAACSKSAPEAAANNTALDENAVSADAVADVNAAVDNATDAAANAVDVDSNASNAI